jgi:hypothetical protein
MTAQERERERRWLLENLRHVLQECRAVKRRTAKFRKVEREALELIALFERQP